jgi:competence protein ComEA
VGERANGPGADKTASAQKPARAWVTRAEAIATLVLACALVVWVAVIVIQQRRAGRDIRFVPAKQDAGESLIDLNDAGVPELMLLPGIGRTRAEHIVNWRTEHGSFHALEEVRKAAGMSARDLEGIRNMVTLSEDRSEAPPEMIPPETDSE